MSGNTRNIVKSFAAKGITSVLRSKLLPRLVPFAAPPLLILSYPRSGSSWVGKVLSTSPGAAYLREPITQQYIFKHGGRFALVDLDRDQAAHSIYQRLSDDAFQGIPPRHPDVVNNWRDFAYPYRKGKRVLIKEVNPRAVRFYCDRYKPKVLLLVRHPAAVALSFYQLGWLDSSDVQMETGNTEASAWERFGFAYGSIMHDAVTALRADGNHEIVVYRHLAEDPHRNFKRLFHSLQLEIPEDYDAVINRYCYSSKSVNSRAELERTSRNMIFKWKEELTEQQISDLHTGYLKSKLEYFRAAEDWFPEDAGAHS